MKLISLNNSILFNFPKNKIKFLYFFLIILTLIFGAPVAFGDTVHFDSNGNIVDKIHYEILVAEREKIIRVMLKNGYGSDSNVWRDPIKLRQKRIFQWQVMRSSYNLDSLPKKLALKN